MKGSLDFFSNIFVPLLGDDILKQPDKCTVLLSVRFCLHFFFIVFLALSHLCLSCVPSTQFKLLLLSFIASLTYAWGEVFFPLYSLPFICLSASRMFEPCFVECCMLLYAPTICGKYLSDLSYTSRNIL